LAWLGIGVAQVFTNESNTPEKAHVRYQDTFIHLMDWHLGNIFDGKTPDKAYTSIQAVRSLHAAIRKEMTDNPPGPIPDGATQWMSSYNVSPAWCGQGGQWHGLPSSTSTSLASIRARRSIFFSSIGTAGIMQST
jgi:hypothetical protein